MVEKNGDKARLSGEGYALVQKASELLQDVLDPYADRVSVDWERTQDEHGLPLYTLQLQYSPEEVQTKFTSDEFQDPRQLRIRLSRLWRELLRKRTDRLWREYRAIGATEK